MYIHIYIYVHTTYLYVLIRTYMLSVRTYCHIHKFVYVYTYLHLFAGILEYRLYTHMQMYMYLLIYTRPYINTHAQFGNTGPPFVRPWLLFDGCQVVAFVGGIQFDLLPGPLAEVGTQAGTLLPDLGLL